MRIRRFFGLASLAALLLTGCSVTGCAPMPVTAGIPNLLQVTPTAWRSGQPVTAEQWSYLLALLTDNGRRDVKPSILKLDCANEGNGDDDRGAEAAGLRVYRLCLHPRTDGGTLELFRGPSDEELVALDWLARWIASGASPAMLWHCVNGRERTGLLAGMVVRYRYGWTREQAYRYMLDTGFRPLAVGAARAWDRWNRRIYRP